MPEAPGRPIRLPIRLLATATLGLCAAAALITALAEDTVPSGVDPLGLIIGQNLYNAAQVGHLLLLGALAFVHRRWWLAPLAALTLLGLPFAVYLISPIGWPFAGLVALTALLALRRAPPAVDVGWTPVGDRGLRDGVVAFELVGLLCYAGSTLYNHNASRNCWPYWDGMFRGLADALAFETPAADIARALYTLGLESVTVPPYVPLARGSNVGFIVFVLVWTVLPALYVLYFAMLYRGAREAPGTRIQQALCLFGLVHFLFLTDIVDYKFGRGIRGEHAEWLHWAERLAWRIAILLPIYQKLATGAWKARGRLGRALHYGVGAWAVVFFVYQVLIYDTVRVYHFATDTPPSALVTALRAVYLQELGYHGALVLLIGVYALLLWRMPSKGLAFPRR